MKKNIFGGFKKYVVYLIDLLITACAYILCSVLDAQSLSGGLFNKNFLVHAGALILIAACVRFWVYGYNRVWRYAVAMDYIKFVAVEILTFGLFYLIDRLNATYFFVSGISHADILDILAVYAVSTVGVLVSRFVYLLIVGGHGASSAKEKSKAIIVGAGEAGVLLADELLGHESRYVPVAFVDTDAEKIGKRIRGIRVCAESDGAGSIVQRFGADIAIIAIPSLALEEKKRLVKKFADTGCKVRIYDYQIKLDNSSETSDKLKMREVKIEDLLGRETVSLDSAKSRESFAGKTVLVTGAGGSIGSELCRQIADSNAKKLVMLDVYENGLYDVQQELKRKHGASLSIEAVIATVCDTVELDRVFTAFKPDVVFHAAAHKHVPLMEDCCREAVMNNVFGTYNVANACEKYGVEKMLLISTDKAVNPTNVMGATKRFCEMIILSKKDSRTDYVAVRFGNVLGSNGSVIPLFKRQISEGGPVTVTDKRIVRYFMTIPEAVSLVLETETMADDSEIFVLDMGEPVKILDLAESLVTLSGYRPYKDIDIIEVGLRPGEKLYEELLIKTEGLQKTANNKIFVDHDAPVSREELEKKLIRLSAACETNDNAEIRKALCEVVPTYTPTDNADSRKNASFRSCGVMGRPEER